MKHDKVLIGLKKARTSLDKIIQMLENEAYCIDIIQQNLSVIGLLKSANLNLLEWHLNGCIKHAILSQDQEQVDAKVTELVKIIRLAQNK